MPKTLNKYLCKCLFKICPRLTEQCSNIYQEYYENGLIKKVSQKRGQTGRRSSLLVSVSLSGTQGNCAKKPSHSISLKTPVNHRYYRDCVILPYTKKEKCSYRRERVINNKTIRPKKIFLG